MIKSARCFPRASSIELIEAELVISNSENSVARRLISRDAVPTPLAHTTRALGRNTLILLIR